MFTTSIFFLLSFIFSIFISLVSNLTSPPSSFISSLIFLTMPVKRSVPICGLLSYKISFGAPYSTKDFNTNLFLPKVSFTKVFNFPSENVPAPPSPKETLDSVSSFPSLQNLFTLRVLSSTQPPRSITIGFKPDLASKSAANIPAGPNPTTTGLLLSSCISNLFASS